MSAAVDKKPTPVNIGVGFFYAAGMAGVKNQLM